MGADLLVCEVNKPAPAPCEPVGEPKRIDEMAVLVQEATGTAIRTGPMLRNREAAMRASRKHLAGTLRVIAAAALVNDRALVTDYVKWFEAVLTGHGLPPAFVPSAFGLFLGVLPQNFPAPAIWQVQAKVLAPGRGCPGPPGVAVVSTTRRVNNCTSRPRGTHVDRT
jgi:hypothetical protein